MKKVLVLSLLLVSLLSLNVNANFEGIDNKINEYQRENFKNYIKFSQTEDKSTAIELNNEKIIGNKTYFRTNIAVDIDKSYWHTEIATDLELALKQYLNNKEDTAIQLEAKKIFADKNDGAKLNAVLNYQTNLFSIDLKKELYEVEKDLATSEAKLTFYNDLKVFDTEIEMQLSQLLVFNKNKIEKDNKIITANEDIKTETNIAFAYNYTPKQEMLLEIGTEGIAFSFKNYFK